MDELGHLRELNEELRIRLAEAEEALRAIGQGQVDAIVVEGGEGARVFSLTGAERVYRLLVETMAEAALTVTPEGTILFCNDQFCQLMRVQPEQVLGRPLEGFVTAADAGPAARLLEEAGEHPIHRRLVLLDGEGQEVPVQMAANLLRTDDATSICLVAADLTELEASAASIDELREHHAAMQQVETELRKAQLAALNLMEDALLARRETEQAAAEAERGRDRLALASAAAGLGVFEYDVASGTATWENEQMRALCGPDAGIVRAFLEGDARPGGTIHQIAPFRRPDGSDGWVECSARFQDYGDGALRLMGVLADITERTREQQAAEWRGRRDELLSHTAARLIESRDPQGIVDELCPHVMEFLDCQVFFNYLLTDGDGPVLRLNAYAGIDPEDARAISRLEGVSTVCGCAAHDGRRIVAEDIRHSADPRTRLVKSYGVQAYCSHPLMAQGAVIGTLSFGTRTRPGFRPEEVEVMRSVTELVAMAVNRIQMETRLEESQERYRLLFEEHDRLYRQQLDIAQTLQSAFIHLPDQVGPVKVSHLYRSATMTARVGGDFYDAFRAKNGNTVVLIGDVSGHGVQAARMANLTKDVIRAFTGLAAQPADVLTRTNRLLLEEGFAGFVTVFLGIIDLERGTLRYASAGHPDALLRRASGDLLLLPARSTPLGVRLDAGWSSKMVRVKPGDMLFLYTDGVTEARRGSRFFGEARLHELIGREGAHMDTLPKIVLDSVLEFCGDDLRDDVAMMAVSLAAGDMLGER